MEGEFCGWIEPSNHIIVLSEHSSWSINHGAWGRPLALPLGLLLMEQLSADATSFCWFSFFSEFRTLHLLAVLNARKRRDSCKYGFWGTVLQSKGSSRMIPLLTFMQITRWWRLLAANYLRERSYLQEVYCPDLEIPFSNTSRLQFPYRMISSLQHYSWNIHKARDYWAALDSSAFNSSIFTLRPVIFMVVSIFLPISSFTLETISTKSGDGKGKVRREAQKRFDFL